MKYETTHPWIRFGKKLPVNSRFSPVWYLLGQIESKIRHLGASAVSPEVHRRMNLVYLAKGVQATTAIEGNTLTDEEVSGILEGRLDMPKSKQYQQQEVQNIVQAFNAIVQDVCRTETEARLTPEYICNLNAMVLDKLELRDGIVPGEVRRFSVVVGNTYRGAPAEECPALLRMLCEWLASDTFAAPEGMETSMALIKAVVAHIYLAWIHPFGDGNGRTARLVELFILLSARVPVPAAHLLSNHYNKTRDKYYEGLAALSRLEDGQAPPLDSFLEYAFQGMVDGLQEQLESIQRYQMEVTWQSLVYESFKTSVTKRERRMRELLLSLGFGTTAIASYNDIAPKLFYDHYRGKQFRTLTRDLANLMDMGLLVRTPQGYRPKLEILYKMLPMKAG